MNPKRILVTGGAGFIGANFVHHLLHTHGGVRAVCCPDHERYETNEHDAGVRVLNVDKLTYAGEKRNLRGVEHAKAYTFMQADICDATAMSRLVGDYKPDAIVHFAAESHVDRSIEAGEVFVRTNVLGTQVLLDAARRHDVSRFVHVSTDEVYGSIEHGSYKEGDRLDPSSPYAASKAASDLLVLAHRRTYGSPVLITRCTNNYGPRQHVEKLLPKVITLASEEKPIPIYGTGRNVRDWLYVKDHCAAVDLVMREGSPGEVYNIGADDERENLDVVNKVIRRLNKPTSLIEMVKDRPGHDWRYSLDSSKLRAMGWKPRTPFEAGLNDTLAWMRAKMMEQQGVKNA